MSSSSSSSSHLLTPVDYAIVIATLIFSSAVGIYHGIKKRTPKKTTHKNVDCPAQVTIDDEEVARRAGVFEYFLAGRAMTLIPIALSFFATSSSNLSVMGPATEVYGFGMFYIWYPISKLPSSMLIAEVFVPLFYNIGSFNIYKFLELRYSRRMKEIITVLYTLRSAMIGSAFIYSTAVAFEQVTNIDLWVIIGTIVGVCLIYTTMGGIRGVIWVDSFQAILMLSSVVVLALVGIHHVGGLTNVWNSNYDTGRLDIFAFELNLTTRHTFWANTVGMFFLHGSLSICSQANMHRLLTAPNVEVAKKGCYVGFVCQTFLIWLSTFIGGIIYAEFHGCDPLTAKTVQNMNQLVPKFVANVLGPYPILPGLFFAGLLSASLSSVSSILNSLSAILMDTFIQPLFPKISTKQATYTCHLLDFLVGFMITLSILVAQSFPSAIQASVSSAASVDGPLVGILLIGIFAPQAKNTVAATAFLGGVLTTLWIVAGGLIVKAPLKMKPMFTDKCLVNETISLETLNANMSQLACYSFENGTVISTHESPWSRYFPLHSISFLWLAMIGFLVFTSLFAILSILFGTNERCLLKFDPLDFIPKNVQRFQQRLPRTLRRFLLCDIYDDLVDDGSGMQAKEPALELTIKESPLRNSFNHDHVTIMT